MRSRSPAPHRPDGIRDAGLRQSAPTPMITFVTWASKGGKWSSPILCRWPLALVQMSDGERGYRPPMSASCSSDRCRVRSPGSCAADRTLSVSYPEVKRPRQNLVWLPLQRSPLQRSLAKGHRSAMLRSRDLVTVSSVGDTPARACDCHRCGASTTLQSGSSRHHKTPCCRRDCHRF